MACESDSRRNFQQLSEDSPCDNLLLEQVLALELKELGMLEFVMPLLIGQASQSSEYEAFDFGITGVMPEVCVTSVMSKASHHLDRQGCGALLKPQRTVTQTVSSLLSMQGKFVQGEYEGAMDKAAKDIARMCRATQGTTRISSEWKASTKGSVGELLEQLEAKNKEIDAKNKEVLEIRDRLDYEMTSKSELARSFEAKDKEIEAKDRELVEMRKMLASALHSAPPAIVSASSASHEDMAILVNESVKPAVASGGGSMKRVLSPRSSGKIVPMDL